VRAWDFHFLAQALFLGATLFFILRPFEPLGYPVAYIALSGASLVILQNIELNVLAGVYAAVAAVVFGILERTRYEKALHAGAHQWFVFGYAAVYALVAGAIFFAYPGTFRMEAQALVVLFSGALAYECIARERGIGNVYAGERGLLLATSGVYALVLSQLSWALALLPIGYINSAGILGAVFFFSMDLFFASLAKTLNSRMLVVSMGLFVSIAAIILGLSRWTI